jgi:hypothetical protein
MLAANRNQPRRRINSRHTAKLVAGAVTVIAIIMTGMTGANGCESMA